MRALKRIQPIQARMDPPHGAKQAGQTPDGRQLWSLKRLRSRSVPKIGPDGRQEWRKSILTGEALYPLRVPEIYEENLLFYLEDIGSGNVQMVQYVPPSEDELRRIEREQKVKDMQQAIAEALVDRGLTPQKLAEWVAGGVDPQQVQPAADVPPPAPQRVSAATPAPTADVYPKMYGPGRWFLSREHEAQVRAGAAEAFQGKKAEAEVAAEQVRQEIEAAAAVAAATPEF